MLKVLHWTISAALVSLYASLLVYPVPAAAQFGLKQGSYWCKCICFSNYTILPVPTTEQTTQPCLTCTKKWCLDQEISTCAGAVLEPINPDTATGKEGDVEARCFERDSPRDQLVVTVFLVLVFGLLVGAAVKGRMEQTNSTLNWNVGTRR
ncbi:hypothetical protein M408DRAFT_245468 [Serendipita vermifera MAFF 305830]|uniref:Uncharacterized protein n=1 Tax=Serendipita vermifera MAFF 305830 TaxID=933852 RepID=A0A0C3AXU5_SERVB|nr:hypothetical protein M408DRAFT_245468 [Serendipita vermifera MAFF 305830]